MSKLITFFLVILIKIISVISVDYCELESKLCGGRQHVGCTKNVRFLVFNCVFCAKNYLIFNFPCRKVITEVLYQVKELISFWIK